MGFVLKRDTNQVLKNSYISLGIFFTEFPVFVPYCLSCMMSVQKAYNRWSLVYDTNDNKTRDLEAIALQDILSDIVIKNCLEIGCGTGKNTAWLMTKAQHVTAVDFSEKMLSKAKEKITSSNVDFIQADILEDWNFVDRPYDLVTFSLVLEHIEDLNMVFEKTVKATVKGGHIYVGELHPFKQYAGSKARFETEKGMEILECYNHHISDFSQLSTQYNFDIINIKEYFDDNDKSTIPRILALLLQKK